MTVLVCHGAVPHQSGAHFSAMNHRIRVRKRSHSKNNISSFPCVCAVLCILCGRTPSTPPAAEQTEPSRSFLPVFLFINGLLGNSFLPTMSRAKQRNEEDRPTAHSEWIDSVQTEKWPVGGPLGAVSRVGSCQVGALHIHSECTI